jgi:cytochrome P450
MSTDIGQIEAASCPAGPGGQPPFTLADPAVILDRSRHYRYLRENNPVYFDEKLQLWIVSRYEDVNRVLLDWETYSLEKGYHKYWGQGYLDELIAILERDGGGYIPDIISVDPPKHQRIRRLLDGAFSPRRLKLLEDSFTASTADLIAKIADKGHCDGMADIATPMTVNFMMGQVGLKDVDPQQIKLWSDAYQAQYSRMQTHEQMLVNAQRICELQHFTFNLVRERMANPGEDMVSDLIRAELDDEENPKLSFNEIVGLTRTLLIGGNDSISTGLANIFVLIATDEKVAEQFYASADEDRKLVRFVEEAIRVTSPVRALTRITNRESILGGVTIPADAHLMILYGSGNEDESAFTCPMDFNPERKNIGQHLAFGVGIHRCVGLALVRMEIKVVLREIAKRMTNIKLGVPIDQLKWMPSVTMTMMEELPLTFDRRV